MVSSGLPRTREDLPHPFAGVDPAVQLGAHDDEHDAAPGVVGGLALGERATGGVGLAGDFNVALFAGDQQRAASGARTSS